MLTHFKQFGFMCILLMLAVSMLGAPAPAAAAPLARAAVPPASLLPGKDLSEVPAIPYTLTIIDTGNGSGTVTSSPAGISCGEICSHAFGNGRQVALTPVASAHSYFGGWGGGVCPGETVCTVTMNESKQISVGFFLESYKVTVRKTGSGNGMVTSNPAGINCGIVCIHSFTYGTNVTLTATASPGNAFIGWNGGNCIGNGTCTLPVTQAVGVTADFLAPPRAPNLLIPRLGALETNYQPWLYWFPVSEAKSYRLQVSMSNLFGTNLVDQAGLSVPDFQMPSALAPDTTYYWRVQATDSLGLISAWSQVWSFRTALVPPVLTAPGNGAHLLNNRPTFLWTAVPDATGYNIEIARNTNFSALVEIAYAASPTFTPKVDLPAKSSLYWRVQSLGLNGPSAWSGYWTVHSANPPSIPCLKSPKKGITSLTLTPTLFWCQSTAPKGTTVAYYRVLVWTNSGGTTIVVDQDVYGATNVSYTVPGGALAFGKTYYWSVSAYNASGEYSSSFTWSFKTPE
ncbi:MAG: hypothetical protein WCE68_08415 [Anaerolineales bacterium]